MTERAFHAALIAQCVALVAGTVASSWGLLSKGRRTEVASSVIAALGHVCALVVTVVTRWHYETVVRQGLFMDSSGVGWWYERKEHLVFAAAALACAVLCTVWLGDDGDMRKTGMWARAALVVMGMVGMLASVGVAVGVMV